MHDPTSAATQNSPSKTRPRPRKIPFRHRRSTHTKALPWPPARASPPQRGQAANRSANAIPEHAARGRLLVRRPYCGLDAAIRLHSAAMWLHPPAVDGSWNPPTLPKIRKAVRAILEAQREDGGWNTYEPGPSEINATVRAYAMLKMTGLAPSDPRIEKSARVESGNGRHPGNQQLHEIITACSDFFRRSTRRRCRRKS